MTAIYEQHRAAFANVSAFVVLRDGERVATIAFKFGGAVTAYVHWIGLEMTRATAKGGGYDRQSAACRSSALKITTDGEFTSDRRPDLRCEFIEALDDGERGAGWERCLRDAGFTVLQAV